MAITLNSFSPNTKAESSKVNTNFQNVKSTVERGLKDVVTDTDGSTITFDLSTYNIHQVVLGGTGRNLALTGVSIGQVFLIRLIQDAGGSRTVNWWSGIKWPGGSAPTLSTGANLVDAFVFVCTGSGAYDGYYVGLGLA